MRQRVQDRDPARVEARTGLVPVGDEDAVHVHGLGHLIVVYRVAHEYNVVRLAEPTFDELVMALRHGQGRAVLANYGLDPRLGKYHRTYCLDCDRVEENPPPLSACTVCKGTNIIKGVLDRILEIQDHDEPRPPERRGPYHYQVPLQFVPKIGAVTLNRLINSFGTEMAVLHEASKDDLVAAVGREVAANIVLARDGDLRLQAGGGGKYGRAITSEKDTQLKLFAETPGERREHL